MSESPQIVFEYIKRIPKKYFLPLGIGCAGLMLFGYGFWISFVAKKTDQDVLADQTGQILLISPTVEAVKTVKSIVIDIEGGLEKPGVYHLDQDTRVQDALIAAGGLSANADRDWVEKHVNLAAKITDGTKIYIPRNGESIASLTAIADSSSNIPNSPHAPNTTKSIKNSSDTPVNINTATSNELHQVPGIGKKTADKIVSNRPYNDVQDLLTRKIVKKSVFQKIKDKLVAY